MQKINSANKQNKYCRVPNRTVKLPAEKAAG